jgi:hypothetical protein
MLSNELNHRQVRAMAELLAGTPQETICSELGIGRSTLHKWQRLPVFAATLQSRKEGILNASFDGLAGCSQRAMQVLMEAMNHALPTVKLRAAECVLRHAVAHSEANQLRKRIEEIETAIQTRFGLKMA